ncbi:hypothetical protein D3C71_1193230 [compost metagenome]
MTRLLMAHMRRDMSDSIERAKDIHVKIAPGFGIAEFFKSASLPVSGVVDEDIDTPEIINCR